MEVWNSRINSASDALKLNTGAYQAAMNSWVNQDVTIKRTLLAAQAFIDAGINIEVRSQAELYIKAQQDTRIDLWKKGWGELRLAP